jgi:hypothetical protein
MEIEFHNAYYHSVHNLLWSRQLSKKLKIRIYKTVIFPVVLYGYETWFRALREEDRLRMFENRALKKIFRLGQDEMTGAWSKLRNEELRDLYFLLSIIRKIKSRRMRWVGDVASYMRE